MMQIPDVFQKLTQAFAFLVDPLPVPIPIQIELILR